MKKFFLFAFISMLIFGCASKGPDISKLNSLQPGISRAELASILDGKQPFATDFIDGHYLLSYEFSRSGSYYAGSVYPYYFVFDQNDRLLGWERIRGQGKIVAGGVNILIPMPSR